MVSETGTPKTIGTAPEALFIPLSISFPVCALSRLVAKVYGAIEEPSVADHTLIKYVPAAAAVTGLPCWIVASFGPKIAILVSMYGGHTV